MYSPHSAREGGSPIPVPQSPSCPLIYARLSCWAWWACPQPPRWALAAHNNTRELAHYAVTSQYITQQQHDT